MTLFRKHVHTFDRHALNPDSPWFSGPWPDSVRAYICRCGEPGFEVPLDRAELLAERAAEIQVDELLDELREREADDA